MAKTKSAAKDWDSDENEAKNSFVSWGEIGDKVIGTLINRKQVKSTLPGKEGEMQFVYELKAREGSYHVLDAKKRVVEEPVELEEGEIISVGGRSSIDSRMARVKLGQIVGLKFTEEQDPKTKGFNPTKIIKVYLPKDEDGEYEMDEEWVAATVEQKGLDDF